MLKIMVDILELLIKRHTLWRIGRFLYLKARCDIPNDMKTNGEEQIFRQLCAGIIKKETLIFFDIGANVGDWTCLVLRESSEHTFGKGLEIHSFEPVDSTFQTLKSRIEKHPFKDLVRLVPKALSSEEGTATMYLTGENVGTNSLYVDIMNESTSQIQISKTTIDAYCIRNNIKYIHYIKIDAEGHDMEVLYGARNFFQDQKILACQFEYNHRWIYSRHFLKDVFDYAKSIPYSIGKITPRGVEIYKKWHPELEKFFEGNYILIHNDALCLFSIQIGDFDIHNTYCGKSVIITDVLTASMRGKN